ncbi:MAG: Ribosomal RNA large subunit methyltransferase F [Candidatus Erwinia impunctatus]|nr:Ribosomal RNA large subunit methyltransferase F [Culicoides impunctatus]
MQLTAQATKRKIPSCPILAIATVNTMSSNSQSAMSDKNKFHPRNRHKGHYDFPALIASYPRLSEFVITKVDGQPSVDFSDPAAVIALNRALLQHYYQVKEWQFPAGFLCPPIPGRADYIYHLADLLAEGHPSVLPRSMSVLDIGCGANCIYPIIGHHEYGWRFTGTEINAAAMQSAHAILLANPALQRSIRLRRQRNPESVFSGIIHKNERYHAVMCNPPFHNSAEDAQAGTERKLRNLGLAKQSGLNFGGQQDELWCDGGEMAYIQRMISESMLFSRQVVWFTSLVSRKAHLSVFQEQLKAAEVAAVIVREMSQGQKQSRFIAWSFMDKTVRERQLSRD